MHLIETTQKYTLIYIYCITHPYSSSITHSFTQLFTYPLHQLAAH